MIATARQTGFALRICCSSDKAKQALLEPEARPSVQICKQAVQPRGPWAALQALTQGLWGVQGGAGHSDPHAGAPA